VGGKQNWRCRGGAFEARKNIAARPAKFLTGIVYEHLVSANLLQQVSNEATNFSLIFTPAVYLNQLQEKFGHPFAVDQLLLLEAQKQR
jgi:hypothetical protein